jgi:tRNA(fMet)-specific endonuclease VapC
MSNAKRILDTDVVSFLMKGGQWAEKYAPHVEGQLLAITFITVGELYYGAENGNWGEKRRKKLETQLRNFVVIPYDHKIARHYGKLVANRKHNGNRIELHDGWIAACAVRHGVPLVTNNANHFQDISGLEIITEQGKK